MKLKEFRERQRMTVKELATSLEVSIHLIYKIESGQREITYNLLKKIKQVFGVNIDKCFF